MVFQHRSSTTSTADLSQNRNGSLYTVVPSTVEQIYERVPVPAVPCAGALASVHPSLIPHANEPFLGMVPTVPLAGLPHREKKS
jgi:hypothetical protein